MIESIVSYLIFNIISGIVLAIKNNKIEGGISNSQGFWGLLFFPAVGWGKWVYHQKIKSEGQTEFPEQWFMYKYMIKLNWIYLIIMAGITILTLLLLSGFLGNFIDFDSGSNSGNGFGEVFDFGLDIFAIMASMVVFVIVLISAGFTFAILLLIFIFIPKNRIKSIETEVYRLKYEEERLRNQSKSLN